MPLISVVKGPILGADFLVSASLFSGELTPIAIEDNQKAKIELKNDTSEANLTS